MEASASGMGVTRWKGSKFWSVADAAGSLVCVAVYRKGALEVARRIGECRCRRRATATAVHEERSAGGMWVEESFPLGTVIVTKAAEAALLDAGLSCSAQAVLARHVSGDWGNVPERQAKENDAEAASSGTVRSVYKLRRRKAVRIVSNIALGVTCVMELGEQAGQTEQPERGEEEESDEPVGSRADAPG